MTLRMYFACCAVAILIVNLSEAQLMNGYVAPYYTIPAYVNPGFTTYQQTLLPNYFKNYVGMPLLPILFSTGVPNIPVLPHSATPKGVKLKKLSSTIFLLYPNPFKSCASPVKIRSTDKITSESEKSTNPIAQLDEEISAAENSPAINSDHQPKPRSPDNDDGDDLDFLTKAANPVVEKESKIGSMFHKIGKEFKHVMHNIESGIHPHQSEDREKSAKNEDENDYIPYKVWSKSSENNGNSYGNQGEVKSVADIMNNYYQAINYGRSMHIPDDVMQEKLAPALKSVMEEFQKSLPQFSMMQNNNSPYGKNFDNGNNNYYNSPYGSSSNNAADPMEKIYNSAAKFSDNTAKGLSKQFEDEKFEKYYHPLVSMPGPGNSKNESSKSKQNPFYKFYEHAFDWSQNRASNGDDNNPLLGSYNPLYSMYQARYNPNIGMWNAASGMAEKPENAGMNAGYYRQLFNPYTSGFGGNYYPQYYPGGDIAGNKYFKGSDLSSQQAQDATGYVSQARNYRQIIPLGSPLGAVLRSPLGGLRGPLGSPLGSPLGTLALMTRPALLPRPGGLLPQLGRPMSLGPQVGPSAQDITASAINLAEGIISRNPEKISRAGVGLGSGIATTATRGSPLGGPRLFMKRDSNIGNIWNSANGLAGSIANAASNPGRGGDQILGSVGSIWNSANNLASSIGNGASNPGYNNYNYPFSSSTNNPSQIPKTNSPSSIWNSATDLAGNIAKAGNGQTNNPVGTIWNSASNLADNIMNSRNGWNSAAVNSAQIPKSYSPSQIWNSATDLAGNIAQAGNGQTNNPVGTIWNSASNLADNIMNSRNGWNSAAVNSAQIPKSYSPSQIWNSATDLAGNIAKAGNGQTNNPAGTIWNSASNLADNIMNMRNSWNSAAANPMGSYVNNQYLQSHGPYYAGGYYPRNNLAGSVWDSAHQLARNVVNPENNQHLQSYGPYYAGGYYPRSNLVGSIWNSAHQLARNVVNPVNNPAQSSHMASSPYGTYGNRYLQNVWNSATNLASGISNAATGSVYY